MRRLTFVLGVLFAVTPARAHDADVISVLTTAERSGALEQHVTMTPATAVLLAPLDADGDSTLTQRDLDTRSASLTAGVWEQMRLEAAGAPCTRSGEGAVLHEGYVELFARFVCGPGELRQSFRFLSILPPNYRVVLSSQVEGARTQAFAQGSLSTVTLARPTTQTWEWQTLGRRFEAGALRLLTIDALALLWLLLLVSRGWRPMLRAVGVALPCSLAGSFVELHAVVAASLVALGCVALALSRSRRHAWWVGVAGIVAACAHDTSAAPLENVAAGVGGVGALLALSVVFMPLTQMTRRRAQLESLSAWAAAGVALFSLGFRLVGTPAP